MRNITPGMLIAEVIRKLWIICLVMAAAAGGMYAADSGFETSYYSEFVLSVREDDGESSLQAFEAAELYNSMKDKESVSARWICGTFLAVRVKADTPEAAYEKALDETEHSAYVFSDMENPPQLSIVKKPDRAAVYNEKPPLRRVFGSFYFKAEILLGTVMFMIIILLAILKVKTGEIKGEIIWGIRRKKKDADEDVEILANRIEQRTQQNNRRMLLFTGSGNKERHRMITEGLARKLAKRGFKVMFIDAVEKNLREGRSPLEEYLQGEKTEKDIITYDRENRLYCIYGRRITSAAVKEMAERLEALLAGCCRTMDYVIVNGPSAGEEWCGELCRAADGIILIADVDTKSFCDTDNEIRLLNGEGRYMGCVLCNIGNHSRNMNINRRTAVSEDETLIFLKQAAAGVKRLWWLAAVLPAVVFGLCFTAENGFHKPMYCTEAHIIFRPGQEMSNQEAVEAVRYLCRLRMNERGNASELSVEQKGRQTEQVLLSIRVRDYSAGQAADNVRMLLQKLSDDISFISEKASMEVVTSSEPSACADGVSGMCRSAGPGIFIALSAAVMIILIRAAAGRTVCCSEQLRQLIPAECLGTLPGGRIKRKKTARVYERVMKMIVMRTENRMRRKKARVLLITGEGNEGEKSTLAWNLAEEFASKGRSVIILDGDMSEPVMSSWLDSRSELTENRPQYDIVDILEGRSTAQGAAIHLKKTGMCFLGMLRRVSDPCVFIHTAAFSELIAALKSTMDYVIIDGPPCSSPEGWQMAVLSDQIIFAAGFDSETVSDIMTGMICLDGAEEKLAGSVLVKRIF